MNNSTIAETLAKTITDISAKAPTCANLLEIITTTSMRHRLADVYAHVFRFYRDAMEWYLGSKTSKFFGSFNENIKTRFEEAASLIRDRIDDMYRESSVGGLAMLSILGRDVSEIKSEILSQRQNYQPDDNQAGERMLKVLEAIVTEVRSQRMAIEVLGHDKEWSERETFSRIQDVMLQDTITREQALLYSRQLEAFIVGEEGPTLFEDGRIWLAEDGVLTRLRDWMADNQESRMLWISSPLEPEKVTAAKAAAMAVVATAWQAKTPIISHFCVRPRRDRIPDSQTAEQAALIGLVYSLIRQLLQFNTGNEKIDIGEEVKRKLDGRNESWPHSLEVLGKLLDQAPRLLYCVIHNLCYLEWSSGTRWCNNFLDILFERQSKKGITLNVLLTTSGQSKLLPRRIALVDRCVAVKPAREMARRGRHIELWPHG